MKLASVWFDDTVVIPGAKDVGGGLSRQDLRESSFHARDGWTINEVRDGVFEIQCDGMADPVTVGGYGYSRLPMPVVRTAPPIDPEEVAAMRAQASLNAEQMANQQATIQARQAKRGRK